MELDKRIIEGKRPLTCYDIEEAKEYIGKVCYVCDEYDFFTKLGLTEKAILKGVEDCEIPFHYDSYDSEKQAEFCIPAEWVKPKEKKYRPFTLNEFTKEFSLGDEIIVKRKDDGKIRHRLFIEYAEDEKENVRLGSFFFSFEELFNKYELFTGESWKPFGIEE